VETGFPRSARLLRPADFKRVFTNPVVSADRHFKVLACVGASERSRLGMAVSRQVDRRAAVRNRIKRVIRESFRQEMTASATAGSDALDCVVLPRKECASICNGQLFQSLERHWRRLRARLAVAPDAKEQPPAVNVS